jgi:hypothetical protein
MTLIQESDIVAVMEQYENVLDDSPEFVSALTYWANDMAINDPEEAYRAAIFDGFCWAGKFDSEEDYIWHVLDAYEVTGDLVEWLISHGLPKFVAQALSFDWQAIALIMQNTDGMQYTYTEHGHVFTQPR